MTSGYSPLGAMIASERLVEPFLHGTTTFTHGYTFGGHPVSAAVAMANLDIFEREELNAHVLANEGAFRATLEKLTDLPIVGDVRGDGYFWGIELVKDKATRETFDAEESERLLRGFLSKALFDAGLYCRADDRGDPVIQLAPPLICGQEHFDEIEQILRTCSPRRRRSFSDSAVSRRTRVSRRADPGASHPGEGSHRPRRHGRDPRRGARCARGRCRRWAAVRRAGRLCARRCARTDSRLDRQPAVPRPRGRRSRPASPSPCSTGWCSRARRSRAR